MSDQSPTPRVGTDAEQSVHREPAPSVAEHNLTFDHGYDQDYARGEAIRTGINSTSHGIR